MNVTGIIAEYNPFHNGHLYQLTKAREETDADYMIVVLSGDFVQRGTPAIADKYIRTKTALLAGADLVLELPVYFSSSSADFFAAGAVSLLDKIGCVDHLSFGSEHGSIKELSDIAGHLLSETPSYKTVLKKHLKQGNSYALASAKASMEQFSDSRMAETLLKEPNNTLGIAYLKALSGRNSTITPHTVLRTGGGYHATEKGALSASAVRHTVQTDGSLDSVSAQMPAYAYDLLADTYGTSFPIFENDFSSLLAYKLRTILSNARLSAEDNSSPAHALTCYADVSEELACRINASMNLFEDYMQFCSLLKTKELTYLRISRALLHILLDIKKSRLEQYVQNDFASFARILGFRKKAVPLLSFIKSNTSIPLISKLSDSKKILGFSDSYHMLLEDIHAAELYEQVCHDKFRQPFRSEYKREIIHI